MSVIRGQFSPDPPHWMDDAPPAWDAHHVVADRPMSEPARPAAPAGGSWRSVLGDAVVLDGWRHAEAARYVGEGFLQRTALTMLSAIGGCGKSFMTQDLVVRLAAGIPGSWLGTYKLPGTPVRVVMIEAENGRARLERRIRELQLGGAFTEDEVDRALENLTVFSADRLLHRELVLEHALPVFLEENPDIGVVVIDPLRSFLPTVVEDENSNLVVGRIIDFLVGLALRFDIALLVIDHDAKTGTALRGASAKRDATCFLLHVEANDAAPDAMTVTLEKARDPGGERKFTVRRVSQPKTADGLFPVRFERDDAIPTGAPSSSNAADMKIVDAIRRHYDSTRTGCRYSEIAEISGLHPSMVKRRMPHLLAIGALYRPDSRAPVYPPEAKK